MSYGESAADETGAEQAVRLGGGVAQLDTQSSWTGGVYYDVNKWLKLVAEYTRADNDWFGGADQSSDIVTVGTFFTW